MGRGSTSLLFVGALPHKGKKGSEGGDTRRRHWVPPRCQGEETPLMLVGRGGVGLVQKIPGNTRLTPNDII